MAKNCPEVSQKPGANLIGSEREEYSDSLFSINIQYTDSLFSINIQYTDSLFRTVSTSSEIEVDEVPIRGPTFKAEINVDNVKTRDGAQVSIVHIELLPKVRETQEWAK